MLYLTGNIYIYIDVWIDVDCRKYTCEWLKLCLCVHDDINRLCCIKIWMWTSEFVSVGCGLYWTVVCAGELRGVLTWLYSGLTDVLAYYWQTYDCSKISWLLGCWKKGLCDLK